MDKAVVSRHPLEWAAARLETLSQPRPVPEAMQRAAAPAVVPRRITVPDLFAALSAGFDDFLAFRSDVIVLCVLYPIAGIVLWQFATGYNVVQLAFPLLAGFALVGPLFATGLYEMSRRRERGENVSWVTAFLAFRSPAIGAILGLGLVLLTLFGVWLLAAQLLYSVTVGPRNPLTAGAFAHDVLATAPGHAMIVAGLVIGFMFAVLAVCLSVISFPMLLDRKVSVSAAIHASVQAVRTNPNEMALWGIIISAGLVAGIVPFLLGLMVTLPILGHATWHLYRRILPPA